MVEISWCDMNIFSISRELGTEWKQPSHARADGRPSSLIRPQCFPKLPRSTSKPSHRSTSGGTTLMNISSTDKKLGTEGSVMLQIRSVCRLRLQLKSYVFFAQHLDVFIRIYLYILCFYICILYVMN